MNAVATLLSRTGVSDTVLNCWKQKNEHQKPLVGLLLLNVSSHWLVQGVQIALTKSEVSSHKSPRRVRSFPSQDKHYKQQLANDVIKFLGKSL
eukprot:5822710-Amphidinium_carterae.1